MTKSSQYLLPFCLLKLSPTQLLTLTMEYMFQPGNATLPTVSPQPENLLQKKTKQNLSLLISISPPSLPLQMQQPDCMNEQVLIRNAMDESFYIRMVNSSCSTSWRAILKCVLSGLDVQMFCNTTYTPHVKYPLNEDHTDYPHLNNLQCKNSWMKG